MSEHTPKTLSVREYYVSRRRDLAIAAGGLPVTPAEAYAEFDRWRSEVIRAAKVEALREAADKLTFTVHDILGYKFPAVATEELLDRADKIERSDDER